MPQEVIFHAVPLIAGGTLVGLRFGKIHTDGTLKQCDTAGEDADGVINFATGVSSGDPATLNYDGFPIEVTCAGTVTAGEIVQTDADGKAVTQTTGAPLGKALSTATNGSIRIKPLWSNSSPQFAAIVALTDSTGHSGTHDDTLAATTVPTITATNPAAPTAYAAVVNMTNPVTKTEGEAVSAALATLRGEVATYETAISALVVDVAAILAVLVPLAQNQSDTAQKVLEILTVLRTSGEITP